MRGFFSSFEMYWSILKPVAAVAWLLLSVLVVALSAVFNPLLPKPLLKLEGERFKTVRSVWNKWWVNTPVTILVGIGLLVFAGKTGSQPVNYAYCHLPWIHCISAISGPRSTEELITAIEPKSQWDGMWAGTMAYEVYRPDETNVPRIGAAQLFLDLDVQGENLKANVRHVLTTVLPGKGTGSLVGNDFRFVEKIPFPWANRVYTVTYSGRLEEAGHALEGRWTTDWGESGVFRLNFSK